MAYSMRAGLVPVGAGDGFLSAAIGLGGPFVQTRVPWNAKNIANLHSHLKALNDSSADPKIRDTAESNLGLLNGIFGRVDLQEAQKLKNIEELFRNLRGRIPNLSESLMNAAVMVRERHHPRNDRLPPDLISDPILKNSLLSNGRICKRLLSAR
jgi:hypothetical protein